MTEIEMILSGLTHYLGDCDKCDSCPYHNNPDCGKDMARDCLDYLLNSITLHKADLPNLRPCIVNNKERLFHEWTVSQDVSGYITPVAIVEDKDGKCCVVEVNNIKFTDRNKEND